MGEAFIVRRGGVVSETTAAPTITIITEAPNGVTFTLKNNDDNTAFITYEIDDEIAVIELAAAATSSNITVALALGTYTLTAYATVVGEVATQSTAAVEIVQIFEFELLYDSTGTVTLPQTQIDITGLSIGKNDELRLVATFVGDSSVTPSLYSLQVNNITTNYHMQQLTGNGSTIESLRSTNSLMSAAFSNVENQVVTDIKVSNNDRFVAQAYNNFSIGSAATSMQQINRNIINTGTVSSITSLKIVSDRTNGIAAGSRIRLYKVNTGDA
jgi:hypothetical protein